MSNRDNSLALLEKQKHRAEVALRQAMFAVDQPGGRERVENLRKKIDAYTWVLAYIPQLEAKLEAVKRERDALMHDFLSFSREGFPSCLFCNHFVSDEIPCKHAMEIGAEDIGDCFEWRGPCAENGGKTDD